MKFSPKITQLLGDFDPSAPPPKIDPVPNGVNRPRWSVMIPTFNCAEYLKQTLKSVLAQDLGPDKMQIEVIDDCSTKDEPEAIVREVGQGRVTFYRKEKNAGAIANFNTCIERSKGELVHILHGDDFVLPGFYDEIHRMEQLHSESALLAARCVYVDEDSRWLDLTPWIRSLSKAGHDTSSFIFGTPFQFAGMIMRRSFFEEWGGFREELIHTADWEMWERATFYGSTVQSEKVLAAYRIFAGNDTGRLMRTAENLRDRLRLLKVLSLRHPDFPTANVVQSIAKIGFEQEQRFRKEGDIAAAEANRLMWIKIGGIACRANFGMLKLFAKLKRMMSK